MKKEANTLQTSNAKLSEDNVKFQSLATNHTAIEQVQDHRVKDLQEAQAMLEKKLQQAQDDLTGQEENAAVAEKKTQKLQLENRELQEAKRKADLQNAMGEHSTNESRNELLESHDALLGKFDIEVTANERSQEIINRQDREIGGAKRELEAI